MFRTAIIGCVLLGATVGFYIRRDPGPAIVTDAANEPRAADKSDAKPLEAWQAPRGVDEPAMGPTGFGGLGADVELKITLLELMGVRVRSLPRQSEIEETGTETAEDSTAIESNGSTSVEPS